MDLKFSKSIIVGGGGSHKGCSESMVDVIDYGFKPLTDEIIKPEESFMNLYVERFFESEIMVSSTW